MIRAGLSKGVNLDIASRINQACVHKGYAHFDSPVTYYEVRHLVENPEWVAQHAFLPLIYREMDRTVYREIRDASGRKVVVPKKREIAYASHLDHRIYQYYALKWGDLYESKLLDRQLSNAVAAYRKGKKKDNISAARDAISFIRKQESCTVLTADFKDFFPSLDHAYLKRALRGLFDEGSIPDDHYRVLKSVLHYAYWPLEDLLRSRGFEVDTPRAFERALRKVNKAGGRIISPELFAEQKDAKLRVPWKESHGLCRGIPQGLAVSGTLSNIYMLDADAIIWELVSQHGGYYARYCDDFIVVLPGEDTTVFQEILASVERCPGVEISSEKTRLFRVSEKRVTPIRMDGTVDSSQARHISYLGFDFDGECVTLRQKTVGKFYGRYHRFVRGVRARKKGPTNRQVKRLYRTYSEIGAYMGTPYSKRNFLSYVKRAQQEFPNDPIYAPFQRMNRKIKRDIGAS